jgi:hypothetical protein
MADSLPKEPAPDFASGANAHHGLKFELYFDIY